MKSLLSIFVLITYIKFSYQLGPILPMEPFSGAFKHNEISIPKYKNLTADDTIATLFGEQMLKSWVHKHGRALDPVRREKLGPYTLHILPDINITMHNYTLGGFSDLSMSGYEVRFGEKKNLRGDLKGRVDLNVTIPKQKLFYDFTVHTGIDEIPMPGHIDVLLNDTTLTMATELKLTEAKECLVLAHENEVHIPGFEVQLSWPHNPSIVYDREVIQLIVNRAHEDILSAAGNLLVIDIQNFSNKLCLIF